MVQGDDIVPEEAIYDPIEETGAVASEEDPLEVNEVLREWDAKRTRLYLLRGLPCPLCRRFCLDPIPELLWTGISLACPLGHGWSNPDALRVDMLGQRATRRTRRQKPACPPTKVSGTFTASDSLPEVDG